MHRGEQVENPKTNISVEWSSCYQGLGPVVLSVSGRAYFVKQSQPFCQCPIPQSWCPHLVPSVSHGLAWHSIFRPFPGIYLEPISCAAHEESRPWWDKGGAYDEHRQSQGMNMHAFIRLPQTGCFHTTFYNSNSMFLLNILWRCDGYLFPSHTRHILLPRWG